MLQETAHAAWPNREIAASNSPLPSGVQAAEKQQHGEEVYINHKNQLLYGLAESEIIVNKLREFNRAWPIRFPIFHDKGSSQQSLPLDSTTPSPPKRYMMFLGDQQSEMEVMLKKKLSDGQLRSLSVASPEDRDGTDTVAEEMDGHAEPDKDFEFRVLQLDLKMGPHGASTSPAQLVSQLEKSSIAKLVDERAVESITHIQRLRKRVEDMSSKVLVTGDLNAGKSTLVNALLRRTVMPVDQQPCTTAFCEVHDASENDGKEEVHIVADRYNYSVKDELTFRRKQISELEDFIVKNDDCSSVIKLYIKDSRPPPESFLNNGVVDISLIDAPGLNRDSMKTTANFTRQEEIDVVVFVVSAENQVTLSAKDFLESAGCEKAYVFIIVNKFEGIRNKERCKRDVLEQIKELSPGTYENADDLVHFVDSAAVFGKDSKNTAFEALEASLRSFVLIKRSKSKLQPAETYLQNLLADVDLLTGANSILAKAELERAQDDLSHSKPSLEKMKSNHDGLDESLEQVEEDGVKQARHRTKEILNQAIERVRSGMLAVDHARIPMPCYPGLLYIWDYIRDVRRALLSSLDEAVKRVEDEARVITTRSVSGIQALGDRFLPEGMERSRRVFMPDAMFAHHRSRKDRMRRQSSAIVAGGIYGLGIGLAQRQDLLEPSFCDIWDIRHHINSYMGGDDSTSDNASSEEDDLPTALGVFSLGIGALTVVGGKILGIRSIVEGMVHAAGIWSNESSRKWIAPIFGAAAVGLSFYLILELPSTIPRTIGRRVCAVLARPNDEGDSYISWHADRVSSETRKVLRIAAWTQQECYRKAEESQAKEVENMEHIAKQSEQALDVLSGLQRYAGEVRSKIGSIGDL